MSNINLYLKIVASADIAIAIGTTITTSADFIGLDVVAGTLPHQQ